MIFLLDLTKGENTSWDWMLLLMAAMLAVGAMMIIGVGGAFVFSRIRKRAKNRAAIEDRPRN